MVAWKRPKSSHGSSRASRIAVRPSSATSASSATRGERAAREATHAEEHAHDDATIERLREQLERSERTGAELVSTLTHDLRNPLSVILVSAKMLARALGADHPNKRHLDAISRAADEMNQMLQDVSDASSIERGRLSLACEPQDLAPLAERAIAAVAPAIAAKGISIEQQFAPALPTVLAEPDRLAKVLQHLLINAIRFSPRGGTVTLRLEPSGDEVLVSVSDSGPGIADDLRPLAFSRTGNGRKPLAQGVGLGLFVTKGIVEAHGGEVWCESEVGRGSRFGFRLPAAPADAANRALVAG